MIRSLRSGAIAALLVLTACSSATTGNRTRQNQNFLGRDEILATGLVNMHEVVQRLRPQFLKGRGVSSPANYDASCRCYPQDEPEVYIDEARAGGLDMLNGINSRLVESVTYISGPNTLRFGSNHPAGIIHVVTRT